ncbi:uroporphyrinogen-III synthase [Terasakiella pusilla]|uniref:uroporphyrinogen-III synthase n=1 Tax=Terasakiella pusilla TaxID=64973 RepID=UPI003AA86C68
MRLLITRPKEDAEPLAKILRDKGHEPVLFPLLTIKPEADGAGQLKNFKDEDIQALLVTSANGMRHFARADKRRHFKIMAVGDATGEAAREAGFKEIECATGDVDGLAKLVKDKCDPKKGTLLHVAGSRLAGDLKGMLEKDGFTYARVVLYSADKTTELSLTLKQEIKAGKIDGVLLYSPRTSTAFAELARKGGVQGDLKKMTAYCLSDAVAKNLDGITFKEVKTAKTPDQAALLTLLPEGKTETKKEAGAAKPSDTAAETQATTQTPANGLSFKAKALMGAAVIVVAVGVGGFFTQNLWVPAVKTEMAHALKINQTEDIERFMSTISVRMAELEKRKQPAPVDVQPLLDKIAALEGTIGALQTEIASIEISNTSGASVEEVKEIVALKVENDRLNQLVIELNARLTDLEAAQVQERSSSDSAQALVASLSTLREVLRTSSPFEAELAALAALAQGDVTLESAVDGLKPYATSGLASLSALTTSFKTAANDIVRAVAVPEGAGWVEQTVKNVTSLVTIRSAPGNLDGEGALGIVARAEHNVQNGDIAAAITELETLAGNPREAAQPWIDQAKARLDAQQSVSMMQAHILSLLGNVGGQG